MSAFDLFQEMNFLEEQFALLFSNELSVEEF